MITASKREMTISVPAGSITELPAQVEAALPEGRAVAVNVVWETIEPGLLNKPGSFQAQGTTEAFSNPDPWIVNRADPYVLKHTDGFYYFTASVPEYDRLVLHRSRTLEGLKDAQETVIWRKHSTGEMGNHIWAPEIHNIDGKWYIYFAAGTAEDQWAIRPYVLECADEDPMTGEWVEKGKIALDFDSFSLDATTFRHEGEQYLIWAQYKEHDSNLYIAKLINPWTIAGPQVLISTPEYDWEIEGHRVNEGPAVLMRNGRIFVAFSASATDHRYCMGLLEASLDDDLLDATSWTKHPQPVFATNEDTANYGPGHNCFTVSEDGLTDLLIYHARPYRELMGSALSDPNRHARVQAVSWNEDGTPHFGIPGKVFDAVAITAQVIVTS
jgi:Predicted beta-xylosidase